MIYIDNCYRTTLKETSYDNDNKEYMTQSTLEVVDFDKLKNLFQSNLRREKTLCSNDALFENHDGEIFMIEFKNGRIKSDVIHKLHRKNYDSVLIHLHYDNRDIKTITEKLNYILVYNEEKNPNESGTNESISRSTSRNMIGTTLASRANTHPIFFGLNYFRGYIFKEVYTLTKKQFEEQFIQTWGTA